jgi:Na+/proline symporter/signal transduction histidine kinase
MDTLKLHGWDLSIVASYLVICLVIGLYRSKKIKTPRQFALGYQNISTTILISVIFASSVGGGTLLGDAENLYLFGLIFLVGRLFIPFCWLLAAKIYSPNIGKFNDCMSVSQIMFKLYGFSGRWITNIATIIIGMGALVAQALAVGYIFHYFLGINVVYGMLISYGILTIYTALGGIRSVIITEAFQFGIFFFIIPASYAIILTDIGGLSTLVKVSTIFDSSLEYSTKNIVFLASFVFVTILPESHPAFIQRCLMAKNAEQLKTVLLTISLISLPFALSILSIIYIVKVHSPEVLADEALLFYISNYLPVGLKGLMVAGIIAAIMGYAEGWLNAMCVVIVNDGLKILSPKISNTKQLLALRVFVVLLSSGAIMLASLSNDITKLTLIVQNFWVALILIPLTSGLLGFKTISKSFTSSIVTALFFILTSRIIEGEFTTVTLSLGILGSALGLFGMHYWQIIKILAPKGNAISQDTWLNKQALKINNLISILMARIYGFLKRVKFITSLKEAPYLRFTTFTLVYYFSYTFSLTSDPTHKVFSYLLVIGYLMCFILLFRNALFSNNFQRKYLPLYWYCTLTFCLPSVASYMLFASKGDDFWVINSLLSAFSLYFFVDAITFIILLSIGIVCGYGLFLLNDPVHQILDPHNALENIVYIYFSFLFAYLTLFRGKEKEHEEKIGEMHMLSGAIAHEVKTPISSMIMSTQVITEILNRTMNKSKKNNRDEYIIKVDQIEYDFLMQAQQSVEKAGAQSINTINSILLSLKNSVIGDDKKLYFIEECVKQAINDYSLYNSSAKDVETNIKRNFKVMCSSYYLTNVILNLLKNAYKHGGKDVKIKIWTKESKFYFKDYGNGIPKENLPFIFDRFYTKNKTGTGIGLAFCKMVMEDLGGRIECESKYGKYTKFILVFPESTT